MAKALNTTTAPTGQIAPFGLRMLPELREKIELAAREAGRSMNAEIVARLERSFTADKEAEKVSFEAAFDATGLKLEVERLSKLLEDQKTQKKKTSDDSEKIHRLIDQLEQRDLTITTLTKLAHKLAMTGGEGEDDLVLATILLNNLASIPNSRAESDALIQALAIAFHRAEANALTPDDDEARKKTSNH